MEMVVFYRRLPLWLTCWLSHLHLCLVANHTLMNFTDTKVHEQRPIRFNITNNLSYNEPFTMLELKHALSHVSETAP